MPPRRKRTAKLIGPTENVLSNTSRDVIVPSQTPDTNEGTSVKAKRKSTTTRKVSGSNSTKKKRKENIVKPDVAVPSASSTIADSGDAVFENVDRQKVCQRSKKSTHLQNLSDVHSGVKKKTAVKKRKGQVSSTRKKTGRGNKNKNNSEVETRVKNTRGGPVLKKKLSVIEEVSSSDENDDFDDVTSVSIDDDTFERLTPKSLQNELGKSLDTAGSHRQIDPFRIGVDPTSLAMESDVSKVLMLMEGQKVDVASKSEGSPRPCNMDDSRSGDSSRHEEQSEEEESDWEEVEERRLDSPSRSQLPKEPVQVIIDAPDLMKKAKKKFGFVKAYFRRIMNKYQKDVRIAMHKVHLLCLIAHGRYLNSLCLAPTVHAILLSRMPSDVLHITPASCSIVSISKVSQWFRQVFEIDPSLAEASPMNEDLLQQRAGQKTLASPREYVFLFLCVLRVLGLTARLVYVLDPVQLKITNASSAQKKDDNTNSSGKRGRNKSQESSAQKTKSDASTNKVKAKKRLSVNGKRSQQDNVTEKQEDNEPPQTETMSKYFHTSLEKIEFSKSKQKSVLDTSPELSKDKNSLETITSKPVKNNRRRSTASKVSYKEKDSDDDEIKAESANKSSKDVDGRDAVSTDARNKDQQSDTRPVKSAKRKTPKKDEQDLSSDSEFEPELSASSNTRSLSSKLKKNKLAFLQSEDHSKICAKIQNQTFDVWTEVYSEKEQRWICIDIIYGQIDKPEIMEEVVTSPVMYVLAFHNDGSIKDLTTRYASQWLTSTWKSRVDKEWMNSTLHPYRTLNCVRDKVEDDLINGALLNQPLPTTISEYKHHPLYALKRHLLKFESFYPDTVIPLGYIRGEAVYARECVHELHSRETWMKEGRNVKVGEMPYKMAKSRPKWKKPKLDKDAKDLCLFGHWQTELYVPPPAVNGKVPINEYGNVEMFQPSMLPAGTVHLRVPGLNKVARKLDLDCVPAMMGWEQHCSFAKPILDGFIVCEEHKDILLAAWDEEQEIQRQKDAEKREKRALGNWKTLVRAVIIRDRLKTKFEIQGHTMEKPAEKFSKDAKATDVSLSWPRNKQKDRPNMKDSNTFYDVEKL